MTYFLRLNNLRTPRPCSTKPQKAKVILPRNLSSTVINLQINMTIRMRYRAIPNLSNRYFLIFVCSFLNKSNELSCWVSFWQQIGISPTFKSLFLSSSHLSCLIDLARLIKFKVALVKPKRFFTKAKRSFTRIQKANFLLEESKRPIFDSQTILSDRYKKKLDKLRPYSRTLIANVLWLLYKWKACAFWIASTKLRNLSILRDIDIFLETFSAEAVDQWSLWLSSSLAFPHSWKKRNAY